MHIEVLTIPGCPNRAAAVDAVLTALASLGRDDVDVVEREVADDRAAAEAGMNGSPTILVDGLDLFPDSPATRSMSCRLYRDGQSVGGVPSVAGLVESLQNAGSGRDSP